MQKQKFFLKGFYKMNYEAPIRNSGPEDPNTNEARGKAYPLEEFLDIASMGTTVDKVKWHQESAEDLNESYELRKKHPIFSEELIKFPDNSGFELRHMAIAYNSKAFGPECQMKRDLFYTKLQNGIRFYLVSVEKNDSSDEADVTEAIEAVFAVPDEPSTIVLSSLDNCYLVQHLLDLYQTVELHSRYPLMSDKVADAIEAFVQSDFKDD